MSNLPTSNAAIASCSIIGQTIPRSHKASLQTTRIHTVIVGLGVLYIFQQWRCFVKKFLGCPWILGFEYCKLLKAGRRHVEDRLVSI